MSVTPQTVGKWRERFRVGRVEALVDEPRPGAPRKISDAQVEDVIVRTLEATPKHETHWSSRGMVRATGLSQRSIIRIWQAFGLQPHRVETIELSRDPQFIEKVREVVGLYMNPPEHALVLCVDEKSPVQALDRTRPLLPMRPGQAERRSHDYVRYGTTSLFAALDAQTGKVIGKSQRRHCCQEFLKFKKLVDAQLPEKKEQEVHLVLDNYGTHKTPKVKHWFARRPYYHLHFTPTSASWLNLVERFFAQVTTQRIRRGVFGSVPALEKAIDAYLEAHNAAVQPFAWTATADEIFNKIEGN